MGDVAILAAARTPLAKRGGALAPVHPVDLLASMYRALIQRSGIESTVIEDVLVGCVSQIGDQSFNIGRQAWISAGLPLEVAAASINMMCGSSQRAVMLADALIRSGRYKVVLAGGVESMSRNPVDVEQRLPEGAEGPYPVSYRDQYEPTHQGEAAERVAERWGLQREQLDAFAVRSHCRAAASRGQFRREIIPVATPQGLVSEDTAIREHTSIEQIGVLPPVFRPQGRISAGTSSQVVDGAAGMVLGDLEEAKKQGWPVLGRVLDHVVLGTDPALMLTGPIPATRQVLSRNDLKANDVAWYEVNEAFASVPLAWQQELEVDGDRLNPAGGAIALGHPLGASGIRLMVTLLEGIRGLGGGYGVSTMCVGGGIGVASLLHV